MFVSLIFEIIISKFESYYNIGENIAFSDIQTYVACEGKLCDLLSYERSRSFTCQLSYLENYPDYHLSPNTKRKNYVYIPRGKRLETGK